MKLFLLLLFCFSLSAKEYPLTHERIDVVIPCHPKDGKILAKVIEGVKKNVLLLGKIYVISPIKPKEGIWIDERSFSFSHLFIGKDPYIYKIVPRERLYYPANWLFQQLLKLYVFEKIPGLSSNVLLLDADTIFLRPISFINQWGEPFYPTSTEYSPLYFNYGKKLIPGFEKIFPDRSGIVNFMLIQRPVMEDLFNTIRKNHQLEPWKALIKCYSQKYKPEWTDENLQAVRMSEYEIYFNFLFERSEQAHLLDLKWKTTSKWDDRSLKKYAKQGYSFITAHSWLRKD